MRFRLLALTTVVLLLLTVNALAQETMITVTKLGSYNSQAGIDEGGSEIVAYDADSQNMFITNGATGSIDVVNITDPASPVLVTSLVLEDYGSGANSVAVKNGIVAVAVEAEDNQPGAIVFYNTAGLDVITSVTAGVLPDMVTFSPDGTKVLSANEGEPSDDYTNDPEGSVTIVDISGGVENITEENVTQITFEAYNDAMPDGVRVFGPNATFAQDVEPEYIAISPDSTTAFVGLQENNAIAVIDLTTNTLTSINALGFKDYSLEENAIDASNEDGAINIQPWPVFGIYMPDSIAAYEANSEVYLVSANEGDTRDYEGFSEEARVADVTLDPETFPNAEELQMEANLGRLLITTTLGDTDGDGDFDELYNPSARSFTIWNSNFEVVFDSANFFETYTAENMPEIFNSQGLAESFDNRSDDKGPEPEALAIGTIGESTYAFIGMERMGGFFIYDITDPASPAFVTYFNDVDINATIEEAGDIAPEGITFVPAEASFTGNPLLLIAYEVSGTTSIYELQ